MKKLVATLVAAVLGVSVLVGCGKPTPTSTVEEFVGAFKNGDNDKMVELYAGDSADINSGALFGSTNDSGKDISSYAEYQDQYKELLDKMHQIDFKVTGESISEDGNSAEVTFDATTYNVSAAIQNAMPTILMQGFANMFSSSEDIQKQMEKTLVDALGQVQKDYSQSAAVVHLVKVDGSWKIASISDSDNSAFLDALSGGWYSYSRQLSQM